MLNNYVRAVRYPDGAIINGTGAAETGYTTTATIGQGDITALYGTGFGPTNTTVATGTVFTGAYPTTNNVTVTIGGVAGEVLFAGLVPSARADGEHIVLTTVSGATSQSTAKVCVAASAKLTTAQSRTPATNFLPLMDRETGEQLEKLVNVAGLARPAAAACDTRSEPKEHLPFDGHLKQLA